MGADAAVRPHSLVARQHRDVIGTQAIAEDIVIVPVRLRGAMPLIPSRDVRRQTASGAVHPARARRVSTIAAASALPRAPVLQALRAEQGSTGMVRVASPRLPRVVLRANTGTEARV